MNRLDLERSDAYHYGMQATHPAREEASAALDPIRYSSVEELQSDLSRIWDVQITQSDPGALAVALSYRSIGNCLALRTESDRSLVCAGQRAENQWILTPITADCASGFYRGRQLDDGDLLLLDPGGEVFQRIVPGHRQNAVSIPLSLVERILRAEYQTSSARFWQRWCVKSDPSVTREMDRMLQRLLTNHAWNANPWDTDIDFATRLIALVQKGAQPDYPRPNARFRRRIVARAEELIRSRLEDPPSITELCEASHASRRALFYAFQELLGRSPSAHAKLLRLHAARRRIIQDHHQHGIARIAFELGFNHPGQFSIDYSKAFGEPPSETRRRARSCLRTPSRPAVGLPSP